MFIIYDLIYLFFALLYLPVFIFRKKIHPGISMRLGILPGKVELNRPIWMHAVSVGEAKTVSGLFKELSEKYPEKSFVLSTVTATGNKIIRDIARKRDLVIYLPFDIGFIVKKVIDRLNPALFIIAETEIWPNLVSYAHKKGIPIIIVNGRISDSSFRGYLLIKFALRRILAKINLFCVQTATDAERLLRLGVLKEKIKITGNMKFDIKAGVKNEDTDLRLRLGLDKEARLFLAASTHNGEEKTVLEAYAKLLPEFSQLKLFIAPRHPERADCLEKLITRNGFKALRISQLGFSPKAGAGAGVFILDTIGELMTYYSLADIVFVGGSLVKKGGHNILEPAYLGRPILFGPHMFNFRDIAELFLKNNSALLIRDAGELKEQIAVLLNSPEKIEELTRQAKILISQNRGATLRNAGLIQSLIQEPQILLKLS